MRALTKVVVGGGLATATSVLALTVAGVATTTAVVVLDPLAPAARADGLQPFGDCAALLDWYQDRGVADVGAYGWDNGAVMYAANASSLADAAPKAPAASDASGTSERSSSGTGTNTQEADVDEPDVAKTDGQRVVRLTERGDLVVTDVSGARPRELSRLTLPGDQGYGDELLLVGDHVLVVGNDPLAFRRSLDRPTDLVVPDYKILAPGGGTRLVDVDLSDPAAPRVAHVDRYDGRLVSARTYDDTVRLVTATGRPELPWTYPNEPDNPNDPTVRVTERQAIARNRALVRATTLVDWLPSVTTNGQRSALVDCDEVLHPQAWSGAETLAVTTFDAGDVEDRASVGLTADGQVVYSSTDRLYVASTRWNETTRRLPRPEIFEDDVAGSPARVTTPVTDLHAFALDGPVTRYVASGSLRGTVRDRWSLDEQDDTLRVAWTRQSARGGTVNGISTFTEHDGALVRTGEVGDLGIDEEIQSVRWMDDLAVLVTFRQIDPLYTVDLTDPARPRALGALKIAGYSGYLHPIGDHLLLGLGVDATPDGKNLGAQAAVFDISDPTHPVRTDRLGFGPETDLTALGDPRAFTWLPAARTGVTTVQSWDSGGAHLVTLGVSGAGRLGTRTLGDGYQAWQTRVLPLDDGRIAVVDRGVRVLDIG